MRDQLVLARVNGGSPYLVIQDADYERNGELLIAHRYESIELDLKYLGARSRISMPSGAAPCIYRPLWKTKTPCSPMTAKRCSDGLCKETYGFPQQAAV